MCPFLFGDLKMTLTEVGPRHYRLKDYLEPEGVHVCAELFLAVKETQKGYWVIPEHHQYWLPFEELRKRKVAKWVSKDSRKRMCYPTIKEALNSYRIRKDWQHYRLERQMEQTTKVIEQFGVLKEADEKELLRGVNIGMIPSIEGINWDL